MRQLIAFLSLLLFLGPLQASGQGCYHLVWSDEFSRPGAPDPDNWDYDLGGHGWGNNEVQNYTNSISNAFVQDGRLVIRAIKSGTTWTSARLVTRHKRDFLYGRMEVRARLPVGRGTWPAVWMLPTDRAYGGWPDSGEIDIMEHVGYDPGVVHGTIHTKAYNHKIGTQVGGTVQVPDFNTGFHTYAIEWTPGKIEFFVDGEAYFRFENDGRGNFATWPFDQRFHLLLNIAIGGDWGGAQGIDPALTEATMEVDFVRVYSATEAPAISGPDRVRAGSTAVFEVPNNPAATYSWSFPEDVTTVGGGTSHRVTVRWGDTPGGVTASITLGCGTVETPPHRVDAIIAPPEGSPWQPAMHEEGQTLWYESPTEGNRFDIRLDNEDTHVGFVIDKPANNPSIRYDFPALTDLGEFSFFGLQLKVPKENAPKVLRLDLIDGDGNNNQHQIFRIDQFEESGEFRYYISPISPAPGFDLQAISKMELFVNYGIFTGPGSGEFWLRHVFFSRENPTGFKTGPEAMAVQVFPNPASTFIHLPGQYAYDALVMTDHLGRVVARQKDPPNPYPVNQLKAGVYLLQLSSPESWHYARILITK